MKVYHKFSPSLLPSSPSLSLILSPSPSLSFSLPLPPSLSLSLSQIYFHENLFMDEVTMDMIGT